jgi:hypothetical protein
VAAQLLAQLGDTTTLADAAVVETIRENSFKSED